jgi:hypothetical protein
VATSCDGASFLDASIELSGPPSSVVPAHFILVSLGFKLRGPMEPTRRIPPEELLRPMQTSLASGATRPTTAGSVKRKRYSATSLAATQSKQLIPLAGTVHRCLPFEAISAHILLAKPSEWAIDEGID